MNTCPVLHNSINSGTRLGLNYSSGFSYPQNNAESISPGTILFKAQSVNKISHGPGGTWSTNHSTNHYF